MSGGNYGASLPNKQVIECPVLYKHVPIVIVEHEFPGDFIQFDMSKFDVILGIDWLTVYRTNINWEDLKVTLKDVKGQEVCFYRERLRKEYPIILIMKASKLLRTGCMGYLCYATEIKE